MVAALNARYDASRVAAVRAAYTQVSGHVSTLAGFAGMVEEMQWGLAHLSIEDRARADHRVLETIFFGPIALRALAVVRDHLPEATARALSRGAPHVLRWLVGELAAHPPNHNEVVACTFRAAGGEALCEHVCRRPTEAFCATHVVPVRLAPHRASLACTWTWGG